MFPKESSFARIEAISWFRHCGEPLHESLTIPVTLCSSWRDANQSCRSHIWDDTLIKARNAYTSNLSLRDQKAFNKWNDIFASVRERLQSNVYPLLIIFKEEHRLDDDFLSSVRWTLTSYLMADAYREYNPPADFFDLMVDLYEAGHFPCGWEGGDWPKGKLIVF